MTELHVQNEIAAFVAEREWEQFHTPENLAKSIAIEAGELLECFQWKADADVERVQGELADVLNIVKNMLAARIGVDPGQIILDKLALTREKYPVDKSREGGGGGGGGGRSTKMTTFECTIRFR